MVGCQRQITAGNAFGQTQQVGSHFFLFAGKHGSGFAETHGHFVGDKQNTEPVAQGAGVGQITVGVCYLTGGTLNQRLYDHGGQFGRVACGRFFQMGEALVAA